MGKRKSDVEAVTDELRKVDTQLDAAVKSLRRQLADYKNRCAPYQCLHCGRRFYSHPADDFCLDCGQPWKEPDDGHAE